MRYRVFTTNYSEDHPDGVSECILETDDVTTANREARELSVPGNTCWVVDTAPVITRVN